MSNVLHLTSQAFDKVKAHPAPVLIDFWAPWCGPCRMQGPVLDKVAEQLGDRAVVAKVNVDEEPQLAAQYGVQAIPTLVVLQQGRLHKRMVGLQGPEALVAALEAAGA